MIRFLFLFLGLSAFASFAGAQTPAPRPAVIDMHVHGANTTPQQARERMAALNVRYLFVQVLAPELPAWNAALGGDNFQPSLGFPCPGGRAPFVDRPCWEGTSDLPDPAWVREELRSGRIKAFGELVPQLFGMAPGDERLEPYWQLAEEFDIPVAIHMGPGPPGAAYGSGASPAKFPDFRMGAGNPLLLEDLLLRHKRLRLLVMHAGWPYSESMIALLYAHPNVYVDVGALQAGFMVPRASYYAYLRSLVDAGFAKRIVFGSDFPNQVEPGIDAIVSAEFLSDAQKSDILCGNATRFLRLDGSTCTQ
ncbi:hypothetical protein GCM10027084_26350 [Pseudoxanthomonas sangjuensis]|uniref:amidohydrolase family protein n=1 Tax=Pseudoxanthomonas sangjuensis TaxID=1503750 RepID=UPI0013915E73|nr:amidohydrolase family protein [Pseudoxanthomonas sangjuensis]KAF1714464.1 hypothetical protein CSC71_03570 [Pseudoxanthomonas sangjuensis]